MNTKLMLLLAFIAVSFTLKAQKLPNVQEKSVYAPTDIKIDGKPFEWGTFQAYNKATDLFYTMANDDENFYLAIQAKYDAVIDRIFGAGITLSIQQSTNKNDKNKATITYPAFDTPNPPKIPFQMGRGRPTPGVAIDTSAKARDSIMNRHNHYLLQLFKWINVKGIKGMDTLISIYNEDSIRVAGLLDNNAAYTLEMAIPLKYLNLSAADNGSKFIYHLQVNGINEVNGGFGNMGTTSPEQLEHLLQVPEVARAIALRSAPTDFWGEYKLAK